jgi:hypothetical protein
MNDLGMRTPKDDVAALVNLSQALRRDGQRTMVLEIGSWVGRTACALADAGSNVWCIDHFLGTDDEHDGTGNIVRKLPDGRETLWQHWCQNVDDRFMRTVFPCRGSSRSWAQVWRWQVDLVFIDADHRYDAVKEDIAHWLKFVRPGGVIAFHDYGVFEGVTKAVDELGADEVIGHCTAIKVIAG